MSTVKIRNVNPLGYVDLALIGRVGPAPYLVCHDPENCHDEHEHTEVVDAEHGAAGSGCLVPGEVFEVSDAPVEELDGRSVADVLLAQVGNYELVKATAKKATADPATPTTEEV